MPYSNKSETNNTKFYSNRSTVSIVEAKQKNSSIVKINITASFSFLKVTNLLKMINPGTIAINDRRLPIANMTSELMRSI